MAVHYIVDKPWHKRGGQVSLGRDGETHSWWWGEYDEWEREIENQCEKAVGLDQLLSVVRKYSNASYGEAYSAEAGGMHSVHSVTERR